MQDQLTSRFEHNLDQKIDAKLLRLEKKFEQKLDDSTKHAHGTTNDGADETSSAITIESLRKQLARIQKAIESLQEKSKVHEEVLIDHQEDLDEMKENHESTLGSMQECQDALKNHHEMLVRHEVTLDDIHETLDDQYKNSRKVNTIPFTCVQISAYGVE